MTAAVAISFGYVAVALLGNENGPWAMLVTGAIALFLLVRFVGKPSEEPDALAH